VIASATDRRGPADYAFRDGSRGGGGPSRSRGGPFPVVADVLDRVAVPTVDAAEA